MSFELIILEKSIPQVNSIDSDLHKAESLKNHIESIIKQHGGVDGSAWPGSPENYGIVLHQGFAAIEQFDACNEYFKNLENRELINFIAIPSLEEKIKFSEKFRPIGFDIGWVNEMYGAYSAVLHEVVFGKEEALIRLRPKLNKFLLFDQKTDALMMLESRNSLIKQGADLENYHGVVILEIWLCKNQ